MKYAFDFLDVALRPGKPRKTGLTIVRDRMRGLGEQAEFLNTYAQFVDFAKISNFSPRLYSEEFVCRKLALYKEHSVTPFFGGILFENAVAQGKSDLLKDYLVRIRAPAIEISNNILDLSSVDMQRYVSEYAAAGLTVFGEWGQKYPESPLDPDAAALEILEWIEAGAKHVILERSELDLLTPPGGPKDGMDRLVRLHDAVGAERLILEVEFQAEMVTLLRHLGRDVNLGPNIDFELVRWLEPSRLGISREMGHQTIEQATGRSGVRNRLFEHD